MRNLNVNVDKFSQKSTNYTATIKSRYFYEIGRPEKSEFLLLLPSSYTFPSNRCVDAHTAACVYIYTVCIQREHKHFIQRVQ